VPGALSRVRELVKPARDKVRKKQYRERWWQFAERAPGLAKGLRELDSVIAIVLTSDTIMPIRLPSSAIFSNSLGVFLFDDYETLCLMSSSLHQLWAMRWGSSLDAATRYTPSDVFETLPRPSSTERMNELGCELDEKRRGIMLRRHLGLTGLYKLVNSPTTRSDADIDSIRWLHVQIDEAVMEAYGWTDVLLDHGFHSYRQMERWTVTPAARVEILDRLLEENHRRAALEVQPQPKKRGKGLEESEKPEGAMF
ncbi:SAM-dependent DNA methyltransferase, partial [Promicromonospora sp. NPDC060204]